MPVQRSVALAKLEYVLVCHHLYQKSLFRRINIHEMNNGACRVLQTIVDLLDVVYLYK